MGTSSELAVPPTALRVLSSSLSQISTVAPTVPEKVPPSDFIHSRIINVAPAGTYK
jgi:hypothetical protein